MITVFCLTQIHEKLTIIPDTLYWLLYLLAIISYLAINATKIKNSVYVGNI